MRTSLKLLLTCSFLTISTSVHATNNDDDGDVITEGAANSTPSTKTVASVFPVIFTPEALSAAEMKWEQFLCTARDRNNCNNLKLEKSIYNYDEENFEPAKKIVINSIAAVQEAEWLNVSALVLNNLLEVCRSADYCEIDSMKLALAFNLLAMTPMDRRNDLSSKLKTIFLYPLDVYKSYVPVGLLNPAFERNHSSSLAGLTDFLKKRTDALNNFTMNSFMELITDLLKLRIDASEHIEMAHKTPHYFYRLAAIPTKTRSKVLEKLTPFFAHEQFMHDRIAALEKMSSLPEAQEEEAWENFSKFSAFLNISKTSMWVCFSERERKKCASEHFKRLLEDPYYFLSGSGAILDNNASITAFMAYLKELGILDLNRLNDALGAELQTRNRVYFCNILLMAAENSVLSTDNPLVVEARRIMEERRLRHETGNPEFIYRRLLQNANQPIDWTAIEPAHKVVDGIAIKVNPAFLKDQLPGFSVKYSQLPARSTFFLGDMRQSLSLRALDEPELDRHVQNAWAIPLQDLLLIADADGQLDTLAQSSGGNNDEVPLLAARFIAILASIEALPNVKENGALFSPRELAFLSMLTSIQNCTTGKSEGIHSYYLNVLPESFRYTPQEQPSSDVDPAHVRSKVFVTKILAEEIEKMFSGQNALAYELTGVPVTQEIAQAAHQALYLKNLIGQSVGLRNTIEYDPSTQVLYASLLSHSKLKVLQAFYRHFDIRPAIHRIDSALSLDDESVVVQQLVRMGAVSIVNN